MVVVGVKPFTGGIAETWSIARHAAAAGLEYTPHTWTNGIGFAINLQLLAGSGFGRHALLEYPYDPPGWVPEVRDGVLVAPWLHRDGELELPEGPGLGFEIDRGALRRWGQRFYVGTRPRVAIRAVWDRGLSEARRLGAVRGARLAERSRTLDEAAAAGRDPVAEVLGELEP